MRALMLTIGAVVICGMMPALEAGDVIPSGGANGNPPSAPAAGPAATSTPPAFSADPSIYGGKGVETAVFAGGCFWCTEFAFEQVAGVLNVESGYCGGTERTANYNLVHTGRTDHAEAIRVTYDSTKVTYADLLSVFFDAHDPTQLNRQGANDIGRQYRSAIFFANEEQKKQAEAKIADLTARHVYRGRVVTKLEPLTTFYPAEGYHQDFVRRNPFLPYVRAHAIPKAYNVRSKHPDLIRDEK